MPRPSDPVSLGSPEFRTADHGGFLVTDAVFPPGLVLPPHFHDRAVVAVGLSGTWDSLIKGSPRVSQTGTLLTLPAGEPHGNRFSRAGARVLIIQPDQLARAETLRICGTVLTEINHFEAPHAHTIARRLASEIRYPESGSPFAIEALALELLGTAMEGTRRTSGQERPPLWLRRVVDYLQAHVLDPPDVAALTAISGVHRAHLARTFRRHHGMSMPAYLRRLRLDWAASRLATTDQPISEIALAAGFADQSHFTRAFRRHTGAPPGRFRCSTRH
jgi:AraC family transcriptional regulator